MSWLFFCSSLFKTNQHGCITRRSKSKQTSTSVSHILINHMTPADWKYLLMFSVFRSAYVSAQNPLQNHCALMCNMAMNEWGLLYCLLRSVHSNIPDIPIAPKKSLPRNGKPGRLAKTIMRKSGCTTMTVSLAGIPDVAVGQTQNAELINRKMSEV